MSVYYRQPDNDPDDDFTWIFVGIITFLVIVLPCALCIKLGR